MRVAVSCWSYVRVAVRAGVLTSHRFPMILACVTSTWDHGIASAGQLVSGLMDSKPQMPSGLSRAKGLLGQRNWMSLVSVHIFRFGARYNCSLLSWYAATLGVWILTGVPLPKSHIRNIFKPVNIISVDNGQTEEPPSRLLPGMRIWEYRYWERGEISLDETSGARSGRSWDVWTRLRGIT